VLPVTVSRCVFVVDAAGTLAEKLRPALASDRLEICQVHDSSELLRVRASTAGIVWHLAPRASVNHLPELRRRFAEFPIVICADQFNFSQARRCLNEGASHYVTMPPSLRQLRAWLCFDPFAQQLLAAENGAVFLADSMRALRRRAEQAAATAASVLLVGESGTGKEILADLIHQSSPRRAQPFLKINCAAMPRELIESELFGHTKGAFTGAHASQKGLFREAHGGTLFLDELAEMPIDTQSKLLRVLQDKEVRAVGSSESFKMDVRIVAATNQNPAQAIAARTLRQDLLYRVGQVRFNIPPLRERREEIVTLARHFLAKERILLGRRHTPGLTPAAEEKLRTYNWPGNIRELHNVMVNALVFHPDCDTLDAADLEFHEADEPAALATLRAVLDEPATIVEPRHIPEAPAGLTHKQLAERERVINALRLHRFNNTAAAKFLGMSREGLYHRRKKWRLP
jgi:DNA-binding NtrC family response regulator